MYKFVNGDTETKLEFKIAGKTEKFNIHELRDNVHNMASLEEMDATLTVLSYLLASTEYTSLNAALLSYNILDRLGIKFIMKDDDPEYYIVQKKDIFSLRFALSIFHVLRTADNLVNDYIAKYALPIKSNEEDEEEISEDSATELSYTLS